jgi:hypothetical protein
MPLQVRVMANGSSNMRSVLSLWLALNCTIRQQKKQDSHTSDGISDEYPSPGKRYGPLAGKGRAARCPICRGSVPQATCGEEPAGYAKTECHLWFNFRTRTLEKVVQHRLAWPHVFRQQVMKSRLLESGEQAEETLT